MVWGSIAAAGSDSRLLRPKRRGEENRLAEADRAVHRWYRFVLSYPPHLVRDYASRFGLAEGDLVLDPFCGTGTTLVECKKIGLASVGLEAHPLTHFVASVKVDWAPDADALLAHARGVAEACTERFETDGIPDGDSLLAGKGGRQRRTKLRSLDAAATKLLLTDSISPLPLHKVLVLIDTLNEHIDPRFHRHELLALATGLVGPIGNLEFGPEVGVGPRKKDANVVGGWLENVCQIAADLHALDRTSGAPSVVHRSDARTAEALLKPRSVSAVISSPPYPNEKDYTRTTRLESVLLGFVRSRDDLREIKRALVRSNTRGVYKGDTDDKLVEDHAEIQRIANAIERRRIELGKTSGFERMYPRVTRLYFGGVVRHLASLREALKPGARLAYVVGDQASYLRVMIRTGEILSDMAEGLGYETESIDLFRTRLATATKEQLREEVVVLRWPGRPRGTLDGVS